jgi:hypothetical protein
VTNRLTNLIRSVRRRQLRRRPTEPQRAGRRERLLATVLDAPTVRAKPAEPARPGVHVAIAASERLTDGLAWEWRQRKLDRSTWVRDVGERKPDLVLLELADGSVPGWGPPELPELIALGQWCLDAGVPLVVWVTSADRPAVDSPSVLDLATVVYVAGPGTMSAWRDQLSSREVELLLPAAQPRLHNPATGGPGERREPAAVVLAGNAAAFEDPVAELVTAALRPIPPDAVDVWQVGQTTTALPAALAKRLVGAVPHAAGATVLGRYRVLVDAGRESSAPWTVVEAAAAGTPAVVLASELAGIPTDIAGLVATADGPDALRSEVIARVSQPELRDREAQRLHRAVFDRHTYAHRVDSMLAHAGLNLLVRDRGISAVVPTNRVHEIGNILENLARQLHADVELVLVLHGVTLDRGDLLARAKDLGLENVQVIEAQHELNLGACLNLGVEAAGGAYIAKMDDDNFYGRHYLTDLVRAFDYTDAGIVGKWAHYVWLRATDAVVLRYADAEHAYGRRVQGGSILLGRDLARSLRFADLPRGVDSDLLDRAMAGGVRIYSADRFNFVSVRGSDREAHTWTVSDSTFLTKTGRLVFYGDPRPHVDI